MITGVRLLFKGTLSLIIASVVAYQLYRVLSTVLDEISVARGVTALSFSLALVVLYLLLSRRVRTAVRVARIGLIGITTYLLPALGTNLLSLGLILLVLSLWKFGNLRVLIWIVADLISNMSSRSRINVNDKKLTEDRETR